MSETRSSGGPDEPGSAPDPGRKSDSPGERPERWLDRLRAVVGMRAAPTFRQDLADALAAPPEQEEESGFSPEERVMLANILRLRDVRVDDVMVPRTDIEAVEIGITLRDLFAAFEESGHSRMPVYRETLDEPVGLVHIKDLMHYMTTAAAALASAPAPVITPGAPPEPRKRARKKATNPNLGKVDLSKTIAAADLVRSILFVPPSMPVTALLAKMQATRMQMALVIDEYGGTDGLVSLEDVVELVVGDIEDEHDDETGEMIVEDAEGAFIADARADLAEVSKAIGVDLAVGEEGEEVDTIGGLIVSLLGRVPVRGELVAVAGDFEIEILDADPRRVKRLRIYRRSAGAAREARKRKPPRDDAPAEA